MKVALRGSNGLYIAAEGGGGLDVRLDRHAVALRANRSEIGAWETFEIEKVDDVHVALKTCDGYYVTAEGGGGSYLRTNETSRGVWETFAWLSNSDGKAALFVCHDGLHTLGVHPKWNDPRVTADLVFQGFGVEVLEQPKPPMPDKRYFRGSFCIPGALPGIPYGDGKRLWTPAYGCYDEGWRANIRAAYKQRNYTHFPINVCGLPYGSDYPELANDANRVARDINELMNAGLWPVVFLTDDRNPKVIPSCVYDCAELIQICVPVWEMNGPLGDPDKAVEEQNCKDIIVKTREAVPHADCWLHFTPGHGSISYASEQGGWEWCQEHGTVGLLGQGGNKISNVDPIYEGKGFETTACRLAGMGGYVVPDWDGGAVPESWNGMNQLSVKFEWGIYESYHAHVTEAQLNAFTDQFMTVALHVAGFCDGGS